MDELDKLINKQIYRSTEDSSSAVGGGPTSTWEIRLIFATHCTAFHENQGHPCSRWSRTKRHRVRYLQQWGVMQCLCHEAVMTCDIFSLRLACSCAAISLLTVSRFRLTEDPDTTWEGLGVYKQDLRGRQARKIHPLAFRGVYLRSALEQCIPEQSDRRCSQLRRLNVLFFASVELPMPIAESHASCFHWFDGRGIIHRFNSMWSWFWTISRPPKSTTGFFWHPSLLFLCFAEHRSCGLVSQKEWTDFCCTHSRATSDLKNRSAGVSYEPCTINLHGIVNQTCTIAHFPCPSTTTYVYSPLPLSKFTSPFLEFVVCRFVLLWWLGDPPPQLLSVSVARCEEYKLTCTRKHCTTSHLRVNHVTSRHGREIFTRGCPQWVTTSDFQIDTLQSLHASWIPISQLSIQSLGWTSRFYLCITRCGNFVTLHSSFVSGFLEVNLGSQGGAEVFIQCHAAYGGPFCEIKALLPGVDWMDLFSLPLLASRHSDAPETLFCDV